MLLHLHLQIPPSLRPSSFQLTPTSPTCSRHPPFRAYTPPRRFQMRIITTLKSLAILTVSIICLATEQSSCSPPSSGDSGSIASTASQRSVRNVGVINTILSTIHAHLTWQFLDEISLALSPSPSYVIRTPPPVPRIPKDLWDKHVDACFDDKRSVWDSYPQATPRTPVDLDDEVIEVYDEDISNRSSRLYFTQNSHSLICVSLSRGRASCLRMDD